jgi:hypothetical protein
MAQKYEKHKSTDTFSDHTWSYVVYTGIGAAVLMPYGKQCSNCHYSLCSSDGATPEGGYIYRFCTLHTKQNRSGRPNQPIGDEMKFFC